MTSLRSVETHKKGTTPTDLRSGTVFCSVDSGKDVQQIHPLARSCSKGIVARMQPATDVPTRREPAPAYGIDRRLPRPRVNSNPYNGFKSDRERRLALLSRDLRLVLIAVTLGLGGHAAGRTVERCIVLAASK